MPRRREAARRALRCAGCSTASAARVILGVLVSLCASLATLAVVVLCFLLVHYQLPQNRVTSDLLMFGAGALLAALYRTSGKTLRRSLDLAAAGASQWHAPGADDEEAV